MPAKKKSLPSRTVDEILNYWHQHQLAALNSVREDKRNLYRNPAVRWWIDHTQMWANVHSSDMGRDFFKRLALAVKAGIGRDKRLELGLDWRPGHWLEWEVRKLRSEGKSYGEIANLLNLQVDESQLRRWAKRRGLA